MPLRVGVTSACAISQCSVHMTSLRRLAHAAPYLKQQRIERISSQSMATCVTIIGFQQSTCHIRARIRLRRQPQHRRQAPVRVLHKLRRTLVHARQCRSRVGLPSAEHCCLLLKGHRAVERHCLRCFCCCQDSRLQLRKMSCLKLCFWVARFSPVYCAWRLAQIERRLRVQPPLCSPQCALCQSSRVHLEVHI